MPEPSSLTPARKLATASDLYWSARQLKENALRRVHPDWSPERIDQEVRRIFMLSSGLNR